MTDNTPDRPNKPTTSSEPFDESLLSAFLDDELAAPQRAEVLERLAIDPAANATLDSMREMREMVRSLPGWTGPLPKVDYTASDEPDSVRTEEQDARALAEPLERPIEASEEPAPEEPAAGDSAAASSGIKHSFSSDSPDVILAMEQSPSSEEARIGLNTEFPLRNDSTAEELASAPAVNQATDDGATAASSSGAAQTLNAENSDDSLPYAPEPFGQQAEMSEQEPGSDVDSAFVSPASPRGAPSSEETSTENATSDADAGAGSEETAPIELEQGDAMKDPEQDESILNSTQEDAANASDADFDAALDDPQLEALSATDDEVEQFIDAHRNASLASGWNFGTTARVLGMAATVALAAFGGYMLWPAAPGNSLASNQLSDAEDSQSELVESSAAPAGSLPTAESEIDALADRNAESKVETDPLRAELDAAIGKNRSLPSTSPPGELPRARSMMERMADSSSGASQQAAASEITIDASPDNMLALSTPGEGDLSNGLPPRLGDSALLNDSTPPDLPTFGGGYGGESSAKAAVEPPSNDDASTGRPSSLPGLPARPELSAAPTLSPPTPSTTDLPSRDLQVTDLQDIELPQRKVPESELPESGLSSVNPLAANPSGATTRSDLPDDDPSSRVANPRARSLPETQPRSPEPQQSVAGRDSSQDTRQASEVPPMLNSGEIDRLLPEPDSLSEGGDALLGGKHYVFYSDAWQASELPSAVESIAPLIGVGPRRLPKRIVAPIGSLELAGENAQDVATEIAATLPRASLAERPGRTTPAKSRLLLAFVSDVEADAVIRALSVKRRRRLSAAWLRPSNSSDIKKAILVIRELADASAK